MMAQQARNDTELEADRLFILKLRRDGGLQMKEAAQVMRVLNERRSAAAREFALVMGKSPVEAQQAADDARLSLQTVRRDLKVVDERVKRGANCASAVGLDEQVAEATLEYERTFITDDRVWEEIDRSRTDSWTATRAVPEGDGDVGNVRTTEVITRRRNNGAAPAALYAVLQRSVELRMKLRAELLRLRYGTMWFANRKEDATFSENVMDMGDPKKAREAAIAVYQREVDAMIRSEHLDIGPLPPEFVAAERLRRQALGQRIGVVKALIAASTPATGRNQPPREPYTLIVQRVSSGNGQEQEGGGQP